MMSGSALDFVQRMTSGNQHFLWRAAAVRASSAKVVRFDHRDRHSSAPDRACNANTSVAAAEDHHVEWL
jgi:hypothetical protein